MQKQKLAKRKELQHRPKSLHIFPTIIVSLRAFLHCVFSNIDPKVCTFFRPVIVSNLQIEFQDIFCSLKFKVFTQILLTTRWPFKRSQVLKYNEYYTLCNFFCNCIEPYSDLLLTIVTFPSRRQLFSWNSVIVIVCAFLFLLTFLSLVICLYLCFS